jgi:hypothetical protein
MFVLAFHNIKCYRWLCIKSVFRSSWSIRKWWYWNLLCYCSLNMYLNDNVPYVCCGLILLIKVALSCGVKLLQNTLAIRTNCIFDFDTLSLNSGYVSLIGTIHQVQWSIIKTIVKCHILYSAFKNDGETCLLHNLCYWYHDLQITPQWKFHNSPPQMWRNFLNKIACFSFYSFCFSFEV